MTLARTYPSAAIARTLRAAIGADGGEGLVLRVRGPRLAVRLESASPGTARSTLDDLLACLAAAERTAGVSPVRSASGRTERAAP